MGFCCKRIRGLGLFGSYLQSFYRTSIRPEERRNIFRNFNPPLVRTARKLTGLKVRNNDAERKIYFRFIAVDFRRKYTGRRKPSEVRKAQSNRTCGKLFANYRKWELKEKIVAFRRIMGLALNFGRQFRKEGLKRHIDKARNRDGCLDGLNKIGIRRVDNRT